MPPTTPAQAPGLDVFDRLMTVARVRKISAAQVARDTGIRASMLSIWNRRTIRPGSKGPSYGELDRIAHSVTGKSLAEFLTAKDNGVATNDTI